MGDISLSQFKEENRQNEKLSLFSFSKIYIFAAFSSPGTNAAHIRTLKSPVKTQPHKVTLQLCSFCNWIFCYIGLFFNFWPFCNFVCFVICAFYYLGCFVSWWFTIWAFCFRVFCLWVYIFLPWLPVIYNAWSWYLSQQKELN